MEISNFQVKSKNVSLVEEKKMLTTRTRMRVLAALENDHNKQKSNEEMLRKQAILKEIINGEHSYLEKLEVLHKYLHHPVFENHKLLVKNIDNILADLHARHTLFLQKLHSSLSVGQALFELIPYLKLYTSYFTYMEQASAIILNQNNHTVIPWERLEELLYKPVQHVCRYEVLFEQLLQVTSSEHGDYAHLKEALDSVHHVSIKIGEIWGVQDNLQKMFRIQRALVGGQPKIFIPGRKLLKEGKLMKVNRRGDSAHERVFFLFNDIMMWCKLNPKADSWEIPGSLTLCSTILLQSCTADIVLGSSMFKIKSCEGNLLLYSTDTGVSQAWADSIQYAAKHCQEKWKEVEKENKARHIPLKRAVLVRRQRSQPQLQRPTDPSLWGSFRSNSGISRQFDDQFSTNISNHGLFWRTFRQFIPIK